MRRCTKEQVLAAQVSQQPEPVSSLRPDVPAAFDAIVATMMEKEPERRYQPPAALAEDLAPWAG